MTTKKINSIKDKIEKLLKVASSTYSEEEAKSAVLKARKLMMKYNIEDRDIKNETQVVEIETPIKLTRVWMQGLVTTFAEYLRVKIFFAKYSNEKFQYLTVLGLEDDAKMYITFIENIIKLVSKLGSKHIKENNIEKQKDIQMNTYVSGFSSAVVEVWEMQNKEIVEEEAKNDKIREIKGECTSLITLQVPSVVSDIYNKLRGQGKTKETVIKTSDDSNMFSKGYNDGKEYMEKKGIENNRGELLTT